MSTSFNQGGSLRQGAKRVAQLGFRAAGVCVSHSRCAQQGYTNRADCKYTEAGANKREWPSKTSFSTLTPTQLLNRVLSFLSKTRARSARTCYVVYVVK